MSFSVSPLRGNKLLSTLPRAELAQLRPWLTRVRWVNGQVLYEAGERIKHVFFVEQGFASMVAQANDGGNGVKIGLIGRDGMVGYPVLLGEHAASYSRAIVQMPGGALRMLASALCYNLDAMPVLHRLLFQVLEVSMAHGGAINSLQQSTQPAATPGTLAAAGA